MERLGEGLEGLLFNPGGLQCYCTLYFVFCQGLFKVLQNT